MTSEGRVRGTGGEILQRDADGDMAAAVDAQRRNTHAGHGALERDNARCRREDVDGGLVDVCLRDGVVEVAQEAVRRVCGPVDGQGAAAKTSAKSKGPGPIGRSGPARAQPPSVPRERVPPPTG